MFEFTLVFSIYFTLTHITSHPCLTMSVIKLIFFFSDCYNSAYFLYFFDSVEINRLRKANENEFSVIRTVNLVYILQLLLVQKVRTSILHE